MASKTRTIVITVVGDPVELCVTTEKLVIENKCQNISVANGTTQVFVASTSVEKIVIDPSG